MLISVEIAKLARNVLNKQQLKRTKKYSQMLHSNEKHNILNAHIATLFKNMHIKPLLYIKTHAIGRHVFSTRVAVKYLGDYIDILIKAFAYEKTNSKLCLNKPLGKNISVIAKYMPKNLCTNIKLFNKLFYVPAKHDFSEPIKPRKHLFTENELVYAISITYALGERIVKFSKLAFEVYSGKINLSELKVDREWVVKRF